ncbi:MAG TPA: hypothetical protein VMI54_05885 [Polyangiaceae bacterium]|nr:hypothetical protein [Polyangiaceae bacterium]
MRSLHAWVAAAALVVLPARAFAQDEPGPMPASHAGFTAHQTAPDTVDPAPDLKAGSIEATLLDPDEHPLPNLDVRLGIMFNKVAEGESRSEKNTQAGPDGVAHFDGLQIGSAYAYRVTVRRGAALYASTPFNLKEAGGMRVTLHVFPVTQDLNSAAVGMRGFFYIETRDEVFQIEGLFRVINLGRTAWVPQDVVIGLPDGWKAFSAGESMYDSKFEAVEGRGARLVGTYPPGQRDVNFRFQVPKEAASSATFRFTPPPRSAEIRVIAVANPAMGLEVDGFEPPQVSIGPSGDRVLVTRKLAARGETQVAPFTATLTGLPVPGPGRWIAILIALAFGGAGWAAAAGKWRFVSTERIQTDKARARELLLDELVALTRAKERGEVGPQTYERTHRALMDALARIGMPEPKPRKASRKPQRV